MTNIHSYMANHKKSQNDKTTLPFIVLQTEKRNVGMKEVMQSAPWDICEERYECTPSQTTLFRCRNLSVTIFIAQCFTLQTQFQIEYDDDFATTRVVLMKHSHGERKSLSKHRMKFSAQSQQLGNCRLPLFSGNSLLCLHNTFS
ncbi:CLUMA_CG000575, isoform A [Clunio marinus]|uniref:CLUMA_CG000575, isoform A n=1 Tax=Clunio marinus TaxID=568069 RepID=A0A1J1HJU6_9DIPT|nr:CLUMA_CG000575, isoform A [Clunio marinus]